METKEENALSAFSKETLNEMAMENVEGGILDNLKFNVPKCPTTTNNCAGGNCPCTPNEGEVQPPDEH